MNGWVYKILNGVGMVCAGSVITCAVIIGLGLVILVFIEGI